MNAYKTGGCSDREKYLRNQEILYRKKMGEGFVIKVFYLPHPDRLFLPVYLYRFPCVVLQ